MYKFGSIVLVPFPFTDLTSAKVRPALIISKDNQKMEDVIVCFISSKESSNKKHSIAIESTKDTGLKVRSVVRFDKIATLNKRVILGELGKTNDRFLKKHRSKFYGVFGF